MYRKIYIFGGDTIKVFKLFANGPSAKQFKSVIVVFLKPLLLILRSKHGSICCPSKPKQKQAFLSPCKVSARVLQNIIMNASTAACHRGGWDNTELMHTADPCLLGNVYTWISDSPVGSLETSVILFVLSQAMVETVNNLLQPQASNAWRDLTTSDQLRAATMLLDTVEQSAFVLADNLLKTDIVRENTDNIRKWPLLYRRAREPCIAKEGKDKSIYGGLDSK